MKLIMLVIDKNIKVTKKEQSEWKKHGVSTVRAESMQEAIKYIEKENYILIVINADSINYLPLLKIMREITSIPIFIITSNFTAERQTEAYRNGADGYAPFQSTVEKNIESALVLLQRINDRKKQLSKDASFISCNGLFVFRSFRKVFWKDAEIKLKRKEFDILYLLMENQGHVLTYQQIFKNIWGEEYAESDKYVLWNQVNHLRKKLKIDKKLYKVIQTHHGVGYSFDVNSDKN